MAFKAINHVKHFPPVIVLFATRISRTAEVLLSAAFQIASFLMPSKFFLDLLMTQI
jgi:hypothetical protein